jgi:hypothetical protein
MTLIILAAIGLIWTLRYSYRTAYAETIKDGLARREAAETYILLSKYYHPKLSQQELEELNALRWD